MSPRTLALSLAPLFAATLAHAQAPGQLAPAAPLEPVSVCAPPCGGGGGRSVMDDRWAIGVSLGAMSLEPQAGPGPATGFAIAELALRFRATLHLELELSAGGGRERTADDRQGDLEVGAVALAARYRFLPEAAWNGFVMAGIGGAAITRHDATREERDAATQPLGMLGIGIERRFRHLALQGEARVVGMGDEGDEMDVAVGEPHPEARQPRGGAAVTLGLSYYF